MNYNSSTLVGMRDFGDSVLSNLTSRDPRISGSVKLSHADGTSSVVACAYPEAVGDWLFIFSLVDGFVLYSKSDVASWSQHSVFVQTTLGYQPVIQSEPMKRTQSRAA